VQWEDVRAFDPQAVLLMPCGFSLQRTLDEMHVLFQRAGWHDLQAVRSGRVFAVDGNAYFNRAGPRLVDSLEMLAHHLQPDRAATRGIPAHRHAWQHV
jgi:iron complex transport system substrate-binding protein